MTTNMRASDADRQLVADMLADHHAAGRLTLSEYDERLAKAYAAVYRDDFGPLFADLPDGGPRFADDSSGGSFFTGGAFGTEARYAAGSLWQAARRPTRGRVHPALLVLAVIGGLLVVGALVHILVHLVIPVLVIGAIVLVISRHRGSCVRRDAGARPSR
jgi:hypothetical protein